MDRINAKDVIEYEKQNITGNQTKIYNKREREEMIIILIITIIRNCCRENKRKE
jgi:hypothetical protein